MLHDPWSALKAWRREATKWLRLVVAILTVLTLAAQVYAQVSDILDVDRELAQPRHQETDRNEGA